MTEYYEIDWIDNEDTHYCGGENDKPCESVVCDYDGSFCQVTRETHRVTCNNCLRAMRVTRYTIKDKRIGE